MEFFHAFVFVFVFTVAFIIEIQPQDSSGILMNPFYTWSVCSVL